MRAGVLSASGALCPGALCPGALCPEAFCPFPVLSNSNTLALELGKPPECVGMDWGSDQKTILNQFVTSWDNRCNESLKSINCIHTNGRQVALILDVRHIGYSENYVFNFITRLTNIVFLPNSMFLKWHRWTLVEKKFNAHLIHLCTFTLPPKHCKTSKKKSIFIYLHFYQYYFASKFDAFEMVKIAPSRDKIMLTSFICALLHSRQIVQNQ